MAATIDYYNPEARLFPALAATFEQTGEVDPAGFYLILDWKAPRARTRHIHRLAFKAGSFEAAVSRIASDFREADGPEQRLELLLTRWGFRLPTASAILAVLYPDTFTIYDARTCDELHDFDRLAYMNWSDGLWPENQRFVSAVRAVAPDLSLRDCDRTLWGRNKQRQMDAEISSSR
jgi:hypothetical protein